MRKKPLDPETRLSNIPHPFNLQFIHRTSFLLFFQISLNCRLTFHHFTRKRLTPTKAGESFVSYILLRLLYIFTLIFILDLYFGSYNNLQSFCRKIRKNTHWLPSPFNSTSTHCNYPYWKR